jgi:hypothetical protein
MKQKITTIENLKDFLALQDWGVKSWDYSPVPEITLPTTFEFVAGSASFSQISNYSGASIPVAGMDIFRRDLKDYPYVINANHYTIYSTGIQSLFEIVEDKPDYHWVKSFSEIPEDILKVVPPSTINNLETLLKEGYIGNIGLAIGEKKNNSKT